MKTVTKNTTELSIGDVVLYYGMRVELLSGGAVEHMEGVFAFAGRVLNVAEVDAKGIVPKSWRVATTLRDEATGIERGAFWSIQGNELATWTVEVPDAIDPKSLVVGDRFEHWSPTGGEWQVIATSEDGIKVRSDLRAVRNMTWDYIASKGGIRAMRTR